VLIEKATAQELKAPNSEYNMAIINEVNSRADMSKEAAKLLKKKISQGNVKEIFLSLIVIDMAMQKCGNPFHTQIGTKEFMNAMVLLLHNKDLQKEIRKKVLVLIE